MKQGFIKLSRKFFENALWKEPRQYSRSEAWLDLIQMAGFEDSKYILNNRAIEVQRGEIIASRRFLENRWLWGSTKVTNFLDYLKKEGMINQRQTNGQTIIILCNYDTYNYSQTSDYIENKPEANQRQTRGKPQTNQNKEYKESKEGKESKEENNNPPLSPPEGECQENKNDSKEINSKARFLFEDYFKITFSSDYYWTTKDAGAMSQLLKKINFSRKQKGMSTDDDSMVKALRAFLDSIKDTWILEHFSVTIINSKYNEIVASAKDLKSNQNYKNGNNSVSRKTPNSKGSDFD